MRWFVVLGVAEAVVLVAYVLAELTEVDVSPVSGLMRIVLAVSAALVAGGSYHAWSAAPTTRSLCAMILGLLGGASLVSAVVSATDGHVYGNAGMAVIGTVAVVASVAVTQIGVIGAQEEAR